MTGAPTAVAAVAAVWGWSAAGAGEAAGAEAGAAGTGGSPAGGVAAGGVGTGLTGSNESGSTYPSGAAARRIPRWTYGWDSSGSPEGPTVPTASPSTTDEPSATENEPRCVSVTAYPSAVVIVRLLPEAGTVPAKVTVPAAGATTAAPASAPRSTPRCWPAAYGCAGSKTNGCRTGPSAGQLHAPAAGARTSAATTAASRTRRTDVCCMCSPLRSKSLDRSRETPPNRRRRYENVCSHAR